MRLGGRPPVYRRSLWRFSARRGEPRLPSNQSESAADPALEAAAALAADRTAALDQAEADRAAEAGRAVGSAAAARPAGAPAAAWQGGAQPAGAGYVRGAAHASPAVR